jgi:DNA polymerase-1
MLQLVGNGVAMVSLTKGPERIDPPQVVVKTGVPPEKIVDWLAMVGDTADNIPGVPGVGPKTAAKLLTQFESMDALWQNLDQVESERIRGLLQEHKPAVLRNQKLMRLRLDMPFTPDWDAYAVRGPDLDKLLPYLDQMEFHGMAKTVRENASRLF